MHFFDMITDLNHWNIFFASDAFHCPIETFNFVILNLGLGGFEIAAFISAWQNSTNYPNLFGNNTPDGLIPCAMGRHKMFHSTAQKDF
jgi:hypothetical protein